MNATYIIDLMLIELKLIKDKYDNGMLTGMEVREQTEDAIQFYALYVKEK